MRSHQLTIGCLSLSALIMLVGLLVLAGIETQRAQASGMIDRGGSYTMLTGQMSSGSELVYLIDSRTNKLVVYGINSTTKELVRWDVLQLDDSQTNQPPRSGKLKP